MSCCCSLAGTNACDSCTNNPSKLSRGYAETVPFNVHEQAARIRADMERRMEDAPHHNNLKGLKQFNEDLLRQQIEDAILDGCFVSKDEIDCKMAVDNIMKIMEEMK